MKSQAAEKSITEINTFSNVSTFASNDAPAREMTPREKLARMTDIALSYHEELVYLLRVAASEMRDSYVIDGIYPQILRTLEMITKNELR